MPGIFLSISIFLEMPGIFVYFGGISGSKENAWHMLGI